MQRAETQRQFQEFEVKNYSHFDSQYELVEKIGEG
jgi:hypothetical protein